MTLLLIVVFGTIAEVLVWIGVGDLGGSMWYVFFWFIIAFFIGLNLCLLKHLQHYAAITANADDWTAWE